MQVNTYFAIPQLKEEQLDKQTVVVIDVLRASTTICTALRNGVRSVIPVADFAQATEIKTRIGRDSILLGGENDGLRIPGFDLGNSPEEYRPEVLAGKSLAFVSSNGTRAILKARQAAHVIVAGIVNITSVVDYLIEYSD